MSIVSALFAAETRTHPRDPALFELWNLGRWRTAAGVDVSEESALKSTAVFGCVRILAESVASLPLILYRRMEAGKERATDNPLYGLLHDLPNPEMTSVELREVLMGHLALWGNAYCEIEFNRGGQVRGLWPLRPDRTEPKRVNGRIVYEVRVPNGTPVVLPFERVMHLRGLGHDGMMGYSPIGMARQAVGLSLATEEFGSRFFSNGARPGMIYEHPGSLSEAALSRLRAGLENAHRGLENAHRIAILEEGMKAHEVGIPPEDAQFLETRKFQVTEVARIFRVPPHMLADLDRATFSNIEHQSLEFVIHTLRPWLVRWEQAINRDLLTPPDRGRLFVEHLVDGLLRGDIQARYQAYAVGRQNGWLSANDIRKLENMNPIEDGDIYLVPLNMIPAGQVGAVESTEPDQVVEEQAAGSGGTEKARARIERVMEARARGVAVTRQRTARSFVPMFEDVFGRVYRREINDVRRAIGKHLTQRGAPEFVLWLTQFYREHRAFWVRNLMPLLMSYANQIGLTVGQELGQEPPDIEQWIRDYVETLGQRESISSEEQIKALLDEALLNGEAPETVIEERLDEWEERRAGKSARQEVQRASNAIAKGMYLAVGIEFLRWTTIGENCPYCRAMNGRVVGIQTVFLEKGAEFEPEGAERPLKRRSNVGHPPLHRGCDCQIVASREGQNA